MPFSNHISDEDKDHLYAIGKAAEAGQADIRRADCVWPRDAGGCGSCGGCQAHCLCPNGFAFTFDQAMANWAKKPSLKTVGVACYKG